jgi:hypothetical protein
MRKPRFIESALSEIDTSEPEVFETTAWNLPGHAKRGFRPSRITGGALSAKEKPKVIGLCGRMGSGKDAAAALLSMVGYQRIAFADAVRGEVAASINLDECPSLAYQFPEVLHAWDNVQPDEVWLKPTTQNMRVLLQWWGTEYRRAQDPDYWVRIVLSKLQPDNFYAISDVRFPNEAALVRAAGGVIWRIERDTQVNGIYGHVSEQLLDDIEVDATFSNAGTLEDLAVAIKSALQ